MPTSFDPQLVCHERGKSRFPVPDSLMGELEASLQKHLSYITQTQLRPQPPEDNEKNTIGGVFQKVEQGPRAFVEGSSAR